MVHSVVKQRIYSELKNNIPYFALTSELSVSTLGVLEKIEGIIIELRYIVFCSSPSISWLVLGAFTNGGSVSDHMKGTAMNYFSHHVSLMSLDTTHKQDKVHSSQSLYRGLSEGLAKDCSNSIANALELLQSYTKPSI